MARGTPSAAGGAGAEAIRRALAAEEQADRDVQRAAGEAAALVERARERARAIGARADRRIERISRCAGEGTAAGAAAIRDRARAELAHLEAPADDAAGTRGAVARVARWLTTPVRPRGGFPGGSPDAAP